ncbi:helix-turn-helix domain-containing protein [Streptomyces sp. NPDC048436]|uniref:helix-turn-helix domain-containing protein n=1 Tax=Streptomyces sp. NPDC048436 TaxID=3365550 RepID=UPI003714CB00
MPSTSDRVRNLMEQSGLDLDAFAERADLEATQLAESLSGVSPFSVGDLASIAEAFDVSMDFLLTGAEPPLAVAARTTTGEAAQAIEAAREYTSRRADLGTLGYPQPWRPVTKKVLAIGSYKARGESLAQVALEEVARRSHSISEGDLAELIEDVFGADVAVVQHSDGFDGLTGTTDDAKLILLAATSAPARQRFTLAHELGHLLAGDNQSVHLDRDIFAPAQKRDPSEQCANAFASAFLMPEDTLRGAIKATGLSRESFATLACELMVSPTSLAYRMLHLRMVDSGMCDRFKRMTAVEAAELAGRGEEFDRRTRLSQQPRLPGLLARDTLAAYKAGKSTLRPYATLLGIDVDELRNRIETEQRTGGVA